ncbi:MAG: CheR family methyltransferase [Kofleriaceae bacterium]
MGDAQVRRLGEIVEAQLGLRIEPKVAAAVLARHAEAELITRLEADPSAVRALAGELTIGETYFCRHVEQLVAFRDVALPERLGASEVVRVLSAGCSSGEEPYTLAMIAREAAPGAAARIAIEAIDVNAAAIEKARKARYTRWSLRSVPAEVERRWFEKEGSAFTVVPQIRGAVSFRRASLTDPTALAGARYDVVFCRNVLMYFGAEALQATVERLADALVPGGFLFLGYAEILRVVPAGLSLCESHGTFYYRKGDPVSRGAGAAAAGDTSWFAEIQAASERVRSLAESAAVEPAASERRDAEAAIADARAAITRADFVGAMAVLAPLPMLGEVALLRAIALTEQGEVVRAAEACESLLAFPLYAANAHYLLAVASESAGDLAAAARHAKRATELAPDLAMAHLRFGLIARRIGDAAAARRELARAIDALEVEPAEQLALHAGGLGRDSLVRLCRAELAAIAAEAQARTEAAR